VSVLLQNALQHRIERDPIGKAAFRQRVHAHEEPLYLWRLRTEVHPTLRIKRQRSAWLVYVDGYVPHVTGWCVPNTEVDSDGFGALRRGALKMLEALGLLPIDFGMIGKPTKQELPPEIVREWLRSNGGPL
jgi:hypothetical protein